MCQCFSEPYILKSKRGEVFNNYCVSLVLTARREGGGGGGRDCFKVNSWKSKLLTKQVCSLQIKLLIVQFC